MVKKLALMQLVVCTAITLVGQRTSVPTARHELLRGRVIADVASLAFGAGLGPKWVSFIFATETSNGEVIPVRVAYAFYKTEQLPPESFWDYSKLYDLTVRREPKCDTTVKAISYERNMDEQGNELPPKFILQFTKNIPSASLKSETALPCYVLWYGQYKHVDSAGSR